MGLSHEHVEPKILAKIKLYLLTRAELLFPLCYEIPCKQTNHQKICQQSQSTIKLNKPVKKTLQLDIS